MKQNKSNTQKFVTEKSTNPNKMKAKITKNNKSERFLSAPTRENCSQMSHTIGNSLKASILSNLCSEGVEI